jgi:Concanavalin A-like lectin/glucanases superfamily
MGRIIILAQGRTSSGYSLYIKDHHAVLAVRTAKAAGLKTITSAAPVPAGAFTLLARLQADGAMSLWLDGKPVASGNAGGLIKKRPPTASKSARTSRERSGNTMHHSRLRGKLGW